MAERHVSRHPREGHIGASRDPPNQKAPRYLPSAAQGCAKPTQILYVSPVAPGP